MTRKGILCGAGLGLLVAVVGWFWLQPATGGGDAARNARARQDARQLALGLEMFRKSFATYPIGDNQDIVKALAGENSRQLPIFHPRPDATNKAGAFVDPWGTAYDISITPTGGPVVRSAGKNKIFGDQDDVMFDWKSVASPKR